MELQANLIVQLRNWLVAQFMKKATRHGKKNASIYTADQHVSGKNQQSVLLLRVNPTRRKRARRNNQIVGPAVYQNYLKAAQRLGLSEAASWDLHIKEDERHGKWMLQDVAKPAVDM
eukprot:1146596-Pelagomonas_calceolata.AAC.3